MRPTISHGADGQANHWAQAWGGLAGTVMREQWLQERVTHERATDSSAEVSGSNSGASRRARNEAM
eukprot:3486899-Pleurochrysis_carterae.AAC.1